MTDEHYDVVIVGAGLLGCFVARNLSRYRLRVVVLERENDLCMGVSRANSAIVYSGTDTKPQTLKTRLTVEGNRNFDKLCEELHVPFRRCGSLMVAFGPRAEQVLRKKLEQGMQNGVEGLELLTTDATLRLEPHLSPDVSLALYSPGTGTVNPWELCIAAAQNACNNGVEFCFEHEVVGIERLSDEYRLHCANGVAINARVVVNCAGLTADRISEMVAAVSFRFKPTRGDYLVLDEAAEGFIDHVVFHEPEVKTKGATFVPTIDGNIMIGPSEDPVDKSVGERDDRGTVLLSSDQMTREPSPCHPFLSRSVLSHPGSPWSHFPTTTEGLAFNRSLARRVFPDIPLDQMIRCFSTMRPNIYWATTSEDGMVCISDESISSFHIAQAPGCPGFINVAGIKTPGLTCADGIGRYVTDILLERLGSVEENTLFNPRRESLTRFSRLMKFGKPYNVSLSYQHQDYEIVCRCNNVTVAEVRFAIREPLGARTVDGVKRRCGTCLGRCQGSFCTERIISLLSEELEISPAEILKDHTGSTMLEPVKGNKRTVLGIKENGSESGRQSDCSFPDDRRTADCIKISSSTFVPAMFSHSLPSPCHLLCHPNILAHSSITQGIPLVIIGGGGAGISAVLAAKKHGIESHDILLIERHPYLGGLLPQCLHAGFGMRKHRKELNGPEYIAPLISDLLQTNIQLKLSTSVVRVQLNQVLTLAGPDGITSIQADAVIVATGCRERPIGSLPVAGTRPSGIFTAGAAQKMVNVNGWNLGRRIVVLGSGDVGLIMAGRFAALGKDVVAVIEQESKCGGLRRNKQRYLDPFSIPLILNSQITHIHGKERITGVEYEQKNADGSLSRAWIDCDTLITSVGLIPEVDLLRELTENNGNKPSIDLPPWVYVAGNARKVQSFIEDVLDDGSIAGQAAALRLLQSGYCT